MKPVSIPDRPAGSLELDRLHMSAHHRLSLEEANLVTVPMQGECRGEPADACPDDGDPHDDRPCGRCGSRRERARDSIRCVLGDLAERPPHEWLRQAEDAGEVDVRDVLDDRPRGVGLEPDVVGRLDARSAPDQDDPPRRLEDRDAVLHRRHTIALSDAEAEPRSDTDLAGADAFRGGDARVPLLGVGEVREVRERVLDGQWRLDALSQAGHLCLRSIAVKMAACGT